MLFSLSTTAIIENIYAASAMYHIINSSAETPPALNRDNRPMLLSAVRHGFSRLACALLPFVTDVDIAPDDDELLTLDIAIPAGYASERIRPLRLLMEHAVECEALAAAYLDHDHRLSDTHAAKAAECCRKLRRALDSHTPCTLIGY